MVYMVFLAKRHWHRSGGSGLPALGAAEEHCLVSFVFCLVVTSACACATCERGVWTEGACFFGGRLLFSRLIDPSLTN